MFRAFRRLGAHGDVCGAPTSARFGAVAVRHRGAHLGGCWLLDGSRFGVLGCSMPGCSLSVFKGSSTWRRHRPATFGGPLAASRLAACSALSSPGLCLVSPCRFIAGRCSRRAEQEAAPFWAFVPECGGRAGGSGPRCSLRQSGPALLWPELLVAESVAGPGGLAADCLLLGPRLPPARSKSCSGVVGARSGAVAGRDERNVDGRDGGELVRCSAASRRLVADVVAGVVVVASAWWRHVGVLVGVRWRRAVRGWCR